MEYKEKLDNMAHELFGLESELQCRDDSINALKAKNERLTNLLEDVVNELDLSDGTFGKHGSFGTHPSQLVKLVLEQKNRIIQMLKAGMVDLKDLPQPSQKELND